MFCAAVVTLIALTNLLVAVVFAWSGAQSGVSFEQAIANIPIDTWFWISGGVIGLVGVASAYKYLSIQGGGRAIAESLGGQLVHQHVDNPQQRQLLNIVEEMAIASGISVPPVYLIPESSINAFAAGFSSDDAVIGINQGTLDLLNRAELQGVVAHEFSHILNGDTNINLRLMAILHGILFMGMIGFGLMRAGGFSRRNGLPLIALGVGLLIIGYGGTFFGNLIKSAVSRQREFLADASAVQFTRDRNGIANALRKIGGFSIGSTMTNKAAEQASHMFFGAVAKRFSGNLLSTHPPLDKRILAIDPNWDGVFPEVTPQMSNSQPPHGSSSYGFNSSNEASSGFSSNFTDAHMTASEVVRQVGEPTQLSLDTARQMMAANNEQLIQASHDPYEARALVYAMLISPQPDIANKQLRYIEQHAERGMSREVGRLLSLVANSDAAHQLTLLDMTIPALKQLSNPQYQRFNKNTASLITTDAVVDVFEWVLHRVLMKEVHPHFAGPQNYHGRIGKLSKVAKEASKLLSILASQGHEDHNKQIAAYAAGAKELDISLPFTKQGQFDYQRMNNTLAKLRQLRPLVKPALIKACATTVLADGDVTTTEIALLVGIAATLDCPLPASIYVQT